MIQWFKNVRTKTVNFVKSVVSSPVRAAVLVAPVAVMSSAGAVDAFDYTTFSTTLTAGLVVVGTVAAGIAAIRAGVIVWKKIASYFNKAG